VSAGFEIGRRRVGPGEPLFVIAEIGLNHGGSLDRALALVDAAAEAGASAVKLQAVIADDLVAPDCPAPAHVHATSLREFFSQFELDERAHHAIAARVRARGLALIATPFSRRSVGLLERIGVDAYKIASGDLTYHRLIDDCALTGKPVVLSTGMATESEIAQAVGSATRTGGRTALLHCVSAYPVPRGSENLRAIATLIRSFNMPVGLSDHGTDASAVPIAVALGASLYERHVMLDGDEQAIDRAVSSTSTELAAIVRVAAEAAIALGDGRKECLAAERDSLIPSRRSLRAARHLRVGHIVGPGDIAVLRPGAGLPPARARDLVGVRLTRSIDAGAPFLESDLAAQRGQREAA